MSFVKDVGVRPAKSSPQCLQKLKVKDSLDKKHFLVHPEPDDDGCVGDVVLVLVLGHQRGQHVTHEGQPSLEGDHSHHHQLAIQPEHSYVIESLVT